MISEMHPGDVTDFKKSINSVIDEPAFDNIMSYINKARSSDKAEIIAGGNGDKSTGYFIEPTTIVTQTLILSQWKRKYSARL